MPSLKVLRKRIGTVRSTQQITRAMKMVAAAKLRRAQEAAERARPYATKLGEMLAAVTAELDPETLAHPLLARREERRIDMVVVSSDRGLCGGYNATLLRRAEAFVQERAGAQVAITVVGRKALEYFRRRDRAPIGQHLGIMTTPVVDMAGALASSLVGRFSEGETDGVYLVYNRFKSAISQIPTVMPLLPVAAPERTINPVEYIFEPRLEELLARLLPRYVATQVTQALLEAIASEHGARMTAMENATQNATDMISRLTLSMNRARQAGITKELMEIVSGAEALKG
jgi:F-type H+-transporting ATPase subunit gamma